MRGYPSDKCAGHPLNLTIPLDRVFSAYDSASGERLWNVRLNAAVNAAPITYMVNGTQYVAVLVGGGNPTATNPYQGVAPSAVEIQRRLG